LTHGILFGESTFSLLTSLFAGVLRNCTVKSDPAWLHNGATKKLILHDRWETDSDKAFFEKLISAAENMKSKGRKGST
jgi:hypothetical protein